MSKTVLQPLRNPKSDILEQLKTINPKNNREVFALNLNLWGEERGLWDVTHVGFPQGPQFAF